MAKLALLDWSSTIGCPTSNFSYYFKMLPLYNKNNDLGIKTGKASKKITRHFLWLNWICMCLFILELKNKKYAKKTKARPAGVGDLVQLTTWNFWIANVNLFCWIRCKNIIIFNLSSTGALTEELRDVQNYFQIKENLKIMVYCDRKTPNR